MECEWGGAYRRSPVCCWGEGKLAQVSPRTERQSNILKRQQILCPSYPISRSLTPGNKWITLLTGALFIILLLPLFSLSLLCIFYNNLGRGGVNSKIKETVEAYLPPQASCFPYWGVWDQQCPVTVKDALGHFLSNPGPSHFSPAAAANFHRNPSPGIIFIMKCL